MAAAKVLPCHVKLWPWFAVNSAPVLLSLQGFCYWITEHWHEPHGLTTAPQHAGHHFVPEPWLSSDNSDKILV